MFTLTNRRIGAPPDAHKILTIAGFNNVAIQCFFISYQYESVSGARVHRVSTIRYDCVEWFLGLSTLFIIAILGLKTAKIICIDCRGTIKLIFEIKLPMSFISRT